MTSSAEIVFEHLRGRDRERIGWIKQTPTDSYVGYDLLWRPVFASAHLEMVEAALDELGLRYLAEDYWYTQTKGADPVRVQIAEITETTVTVAPVLESENVAKTVDLTRSVVLPNPTDQLAT